ncbi:MAG TPA: hypothetical protein PKC87_03950, partial [Candidatus Absconditabacterales bacterium]|nr:hypothetical protein [Candidatus Absconditabacterales bacterium]
MKNIIIGGIATVIVVAGSTILLSGQNPGHADNLETLLQDYQKVAEEMKSSKTKSSLSNNCKSTKAFTKKIERLENKLKKLNTRKNEIINQQKV